MINLEGEAFQSELRVWIKVFAKSGQAWLYLNLEAMRLVELHPRWSPREIVDYIYLHRPATVENAEELASPFGTGEDVLLEQAQYWCLERERLLPRDCGKERWLRWGWLEYGRRLDTLGEVDLKPEQIQAVRTRIDKGHTFDDIGRCIDKDGSTANRYWQAFLAAVEHGKCHCGLQHCSQNSPGGRLQIVERLDLKSRFRLDQSLQVGSRKQSGGGVGGRGAIRYTPAEHGHYQVAQVNGGMEVYAHRLTWIRHYGPIPREHEIHHLDGSPANNDIDNLALLPRWLHKASDRVAAGMA